MISRVVSATAHGSAQWNGYE